MGRRWGWVGCAMWLVGVLPAHAQNWSFDARDIGMGNVGGAAAAASGFGSASCADNEA